jgi:hypothetical protein
MISRSASLDFTLLFIAFAIKNKNTTFQMLAVPSPKSFKRISSISFSITPKEIALFSPKGGKVTTVEVLQ